MTTEDHHFLIGYISSNGCLSVVMLVFRVVNEQWTKRANWLLGVYRGRKHYPVMWGLFHKWHKDPKDSEATRMTHGKHRRFVFFWRLKWGKKSWKWMILTHGIKQGLPLSETNMPRKIGHSQTQIHRTQPLIFRGELLVSGRVIQDWFMLSDMLQKMLLVVWVGVM